ncbi:MAG: threonylcarbamoyl-AMP synthase [Sphingomonadaceae bacterium]|nr:threonylcarbamoyl-AMP synthase [Sphingomonadaceae bacterium]
MAGSNPLRHGQICAADDAAIAAAAALIRAGQCVAVPTETVYGLAGDATDAAAIAAIYAAKGRPSFNPLITHVADMDMAERLAIWNAPARALAAAFWPGALTMVLPLRDGSGVAGAVTAGLPTIALRCPAHPVMRALIAAVGRPLAAPSANVSGSVSPTSAAHVAASLGGRVPMILDGGACATGLESTIVAVKDDALTLLRPGPILAGDLGAVIGLTIRTHDGAEINAPGQLARHYAPGKPVLLDCDTPPADAFWISFGKAAGDYPLSAAGDLAQAAAHLFDALHAGAAAPHPRIAIDPIPNHGIGMAINDRLRRAAVLD